MKKRDSKFDRHVGKRDKSRFFNRGESYVIDFYPHGKTLSRRSSGDYNPVAVVITSDWFQFFDVRLALGTSLSIEDKLHLNSRNPVIKKLFSTQYSQLSASTIENLPSVIHRIVNASENRFIKFLNEAHPLTTQMHQLQLLPGIGQKRMWAILEARKSKEFISFEDFAKRSGISDPISIFLNRILQEIEDSPKYRLFTKKPKTDED
ncbi:MAG: DUF655 domain-containing protein [Candidatus Heimdallarchaeota archaeon]|nr:DUF655 domain-containing protein [Candidatus Heimdallarchaeota archaeon]